MFREIFKMLFRSHPILPPPPYNGRTRAGESLCGSQSVAFGYPPLVAVVAQRWRCLSKIVLFQSSVCTIAFCLKIDVLSERQFLREDPLIAKII